MPRGFSRLQSVLMGSKDSLHRLINRAGGGLKEKPPCLGHKLERGHRPIGVAGIAGGQVGRDDDEVGGLTAGAQLADTTCGPGLRRGGEKDLGLRLRKNH